MHFRATAFLGVTAALNAALLLAGTDTSANDWPHWRGPHRNGISTESGWSAELPAGGPKVLWTAKVGLGYSSIAVVGDRAYTLGNSDGKDTVYCLDAASGRVVWQHSYAHPVDAKYYSGGASATPTVEGGRVYTLARRGQIHCLDAATGAVKWKKNLAEELGAKIPEWGFAGSVLIDGDRAVVNVGTSAPRWTRTRARSCGRRAPPPPAMRRLFHLSRTAGAST
jgi:outer membrane protein assembly factor BamB